MRRNNNFDSDFGSPKEGFGTQNESLLNTFGNMNRGVSPSLIFKGCTVRFACFCKRSSLRIATKNSPREHLFTFHTNPPARTAKRGPRNLQNGPQNPPLGPSEGLRRGLRNLSLEKITFCAGSPPGDLLFACPGTREWDPGYI